jgi:hypothetical protein
VDAAAQEGKWVNSRRTAFDAEATGRVLLALAPSMPERYGDLLRVQPRYAATQDVENAGWRMNG